MKYNTIKNGTLFSVPFLLKHLDCTPKGHRLCQGKCCKNHSNQKTPKKIHVKYFKKELESFPLDIQKQIKKYLNKDLVVQNKKGRCLLEQFCLEQPKYKPIECKLFPLIINKNGKLILSNWGMLCCPNYKKGNKPIYVVMKDNLIDVFGEEIYKQIKKKCEEEI